MKDGRAKHRGGAAPLLVAVPALRATAGACGGGDEAGQRPLDQPAAEQTAAAGSRARAVTLAPESAMLRFPAGTSADAGIACRYAVANPDVLRVMPCCCACGSVGHTSNLDCYVSGHRARGTPVFDSHAGVLTCMRRHHA